MNKGPKYRYQVWRLGPDGLMLKTNYAGGITLSRAPAMALFWAENLKSPYVQLWVGQTEHSRHPFGFSAWCIASAKNEAVSK